MHIVDSEESLQTRSEENRTFDHVISCVDRQRGS